LDEARRVGGVAQGLSQLIDRGVQAVVEVNEGIRRPDLGAEFFPIYYFPRVTEQDAENAKGLFLQFDPQSLLMKFPRTQV
jgi:hypothetical protein